MPRTVESGACLGRGIYLRDDIARRRIVLAIFVVSSLVAVLVGSWTLGTLDRYRQTARSIRGLDVAIETVDWNRGERRLDMELKMSNGGTLDVFLDHTRFSVYVAGTYVATNSDTQLRVRLEPGESATFSYRFTLRQFFADAVQEGFEVPGALWRVRGVVWVDVEGLHTDVPVRTSREVAP